MFERVGVPLHVQYQRLIPTPVGGLDLPAGIAVDVPVIAGLYDERGKELSHLWIGTAVREVRER